jgi:hypothetical protein
MDQEIKSGEPVGRESTLGAEIGEGAWHELQPLDEQDSVPQTEHAVIPTKSWALIGASRRGKSHAHAGAYREDAFAMACDPNWEAPAWWGLAVSDGAGSCPLSRVGSNLAVRHVATSLSNPDSWNSAPGKRLEQAVLGALSRLEKEARDRACEVKDLSCTLLVLLWIEDADGSGGRAFTFQAGDGLIAATDDHGLFARLAAQDEEAFAGSTHFFTGDYVWRTWGDRFSEFDLPEPPLGFLVMTDGVSDDLVPYSKNGPIIVKELCRVRDHEAPGEALVELLGYEKRGSFDDRTLVCALNPNVRQGATESGSRSPIATGEE